MTKNDKIAEINAILQQLDEEEVCNIKDILKDMYSFPYGHMSIDVHSGQIINCKYTKEKRFSLKKKKEN